MNWLWAFRQAVGLSAISLLALPATDRWVCRNDGHFDRLSAHSPLPASRSLRMPLQSLTHRRLLKTEKNSQFQGSAIRHRLKNVNNFYIFFSWQWMFVIVFLQIYLLSYKLLSLTIILITLRKWTILANVLEKFSLKGKV